MMSHGVKIILMGRILEILSRRCACRYPRSTTAHTIWEELNKEEFVGHAKVWIRTGMISKRQVEYLLRKMANPNVPRCLGFGHPLPLVKRIVTKKSVAGGTTWMLSATVIYGKKRPKNTGFFEKHPLKTHKRKKARAKAAKKASVEGGVDRGVERGTEELIKETWALIDKAKARLNSPNVSEREKISWAGVLANAIGTLNRLLWKVGMGKGDEEDLAQILSKIPEKYQKLIKKRLAADKHAPTPPPNRVSLEGLQRGDLVEITWLDASLSRNVVKITNQVVATYKRTVGRFMGVYNDERYRAEHVIIQHEAEESGVCDLSSIPVAIVVDVKKLSPKTSLKNSKRGTDSQWTQPISAGGTKIMTRRGRP